MNGMMVSPGAGPLPGVPQQQPTNLFRFGEITLYSTQWLANATNLANQNFRVFTTQLGGTGQGYAVGLTKTETNLKEPGRIPAGQAYDVYGVACQVLGARADGIGATATQQIEPINEESMVRDLQNVVNNGILSWDFTQTVVDICPIMLAGAGGGVFGSVSVNAADVTSGAMNNGNGGIWMYKKHPVALPGQTTFAVVIQFGVHAGVIAGTFVFPITGVVTNAALAVRVVLLGYYKSVIEIG